jgi:hypothetical protein
MMRFRPEAFLELLEQLHRAKSTMRPANPNGQVPIDRKERWQRMIGFMLSACGEIGLRTVPSHLRRLQGDPQNPLTESELQHAISSTHDVLLAELTSQLMFIVPYPDDELYLSHEKAFGSEVFDAFPSARFEVSEAAKCLTLNRPTACVFHLMRALETGMNVLAGNLKIPYAHANWENVLNQIPKKILQIEQGKRKPKQWRELRQFYSSAGAHLDLIKDAFRNWVMHIHKTYDLASAKELFQHTMTFMRHLSTKLKEPVQNR